MKNLPRNDRLERRILRAIDEGRDLQAVTDWQLRCIIPMQEPFTMEQATSKRLQRATGVKEKDLKLLHLIDTIHGGGLYSRQIAKREHIKAATIRQRISRARRKLKNKQTAEKP